MQRFYRLAVDRLEDRWVPSTVTDTTDVGGTQVVVTDDPSGGIVDTTVPTDSTQYVIDVPPTDPGAPPPTDPGQLGDPTAPPDGGGPDPVDLTPPIDDPYWY